MGIVKHYILYTFLLLSFITNAQGEANIWYFGFGAGIDFNGDQPEVLIDSFMQTNEGCSSISDADGNLLFYTNGTTIWNKNHVTMPNSNNMFGSEDATQSSLIVQNSSTNGFYYVFTTDFEAHENGLRYTEVDMNLNGNTGIVTANKNIPLLSTTTEGLTSVKHSNDNDAWVVTHGWNNNIFYSFLVSDSGVNNFPFVSTVGPIITGSDNNTIGSMKLSPNGEKLAMTVNKEQVFLFDFNDNNGSISNPKIVTTKTNAYGLSFSPSGKILYISDLGNKIYQYNLEANTIPETETILNNNLASQFGQLQVAPDKKIYVAESGFSALSVINKPDVLGLGCSFNVRALDLNGETSGLGMPAFVQTSFFVLINYSKDCYQDLTEFSFNTTADSIIWDFNDPASGISNVSNILEPTHVFSAPGIYDVSATATKDNVTTTAFIEVEIFALPELNNITLYQCDDDQDGISTFNIKDAKSLISPTFYLETITFHETLVEAQTNSSPIANVLAYNNQTPSADTIWVRAENTNGCYETVALDLVVSTSQVPSSYHRDFYECDDDYDGVTTFNFSSVEAEIISFFPATQDINLAYYQNVSDAFFQTNEILDLLAYQNINEPFIQDIYVRISNSLSNACLGLGAYITLHTLALPDFELDEEAIICIDENPSTTVSIENPQGDYSYSWTNASGVELSTNTALTVTQGGIYSVVASFQYPDGTVCTSIPQQIHVIESIEATIIPEAITIVDGNTNNSITIAPSLIGFGDYEYALDSISGPYQDAAYFNNLSPGLHSLFVRDKNKCGITEYEFYIIGFPNYFTPNNDQQNDTWNIKGYDDSFYKKTIIFIYNRYGKLLTTIKPNTSGWDGQFNGKALPASDYWFTVDLLDSNTNSRSLKGHFSLVR